ncbi:syntaxin/t-SNARE family protein [Actinidia rufa]|uniref:Syntaxin/t-SNARE family protein n=1 Tax=Actinidia rufa TaxID=165716 RepID=A0A7J0GJR3_9ERIC|nr:syntaxin/t-SNARE family protein [Actinidia rufa]
MLVANSFDLRKKDTFFSAAEEVHQSADIMESAYRRWEREKTEALTSEGLDELCRELQTALGNAKWQLEEFGKAVRLSYRHCAYDFTMARHRQFIEVIESQISRVETSLRESFSEQGKQLLRWVNLTEDECTRQACNKDAKYVIEIEAIETRGTRVDITCQAYRTRGTRRTWSSPDIGAWKIVTADEDEQNNALELSIEATPKDKGSKLVFSRHRSGDRPKAKGGVLSHSQFKGLRWINQKTIQVHCAADLGTSRWVLRQQQNPLHVKLSSVQFKLTLMLFILLISKILIYLTLRKNNEQ